LNVAASHGDAEEILGHPILPSQDRCSAWEINFAPLSIRINFAVASCGEHGLELLDKALGW